jgi:spore cortex formation protein SpoVR/YcgB (stage V sporulation)
LTLRHYRYHDRPLAENLEEMLRHIRRLWGFTVRIETIDEQGRVETLAEC